MQKSLLGGLGGTKGIFVAFLRIVTRPGARAGSRLEGPLAMAGRYHSLTRRVTIRFFYGLIKLFSDYLVF